MAPWVIWLVLAAALAVAEVFTLTLVLGLLAGAAVLAAGADLIGLPVAAQVAVFAAAGGALTLTVRPVARRHLQPAPGVRTGVAALEGRPALVTTQIDRTGGRVKLGGESWAARALDPTATLPEGTAVTVAEVDGATLVVYQSELT
jgi:membrane protein implicated in regulation of membrane protease activity